MPSRTVWSVILAAMIMAFAALSITPASAQVMKNFSWKKKTAKAKPHEAEAAKPAETGKDQAPRHRKTRPGN